MPIDLLYYQLSLGPYEEVHGKEGHEHFLTEPVDRVPEPIGTETPRISVAIGVVMSRNTATEPAGTKSKTRASRVLQATLWWRFAPLFGN